MLGRGASFPGRIAALGRSGEDVMSLAEQRVYRGSGRNAFIHCPSPGHTDDHPSCSVHLDTGKAHCFVCGWSCGDTVSLHCALLGLGSQLVALQELESHAGDAIPPVMLLRMPRKGSKGRAIVHDVQRIRTDTWTYTSADGTPAFEVHRFVLVDANGEPLFHETTGKPLKEFIQTHPGGHPVGLPQQFKDGLRPLYVLPMLLGAPAGRTVIVVEGEKAADALIAAGDCATTSSGGASQAHCTDWQPLAGRPALLWPDNDEAGRNHMARVAAILGALEPPARVRIAATDRMELPEGGDAADWLARRAR